MTTNNVKKPAKLVVTILYLACLLLLLWLGGWQLNRGLEKKQIELSQPGSGDVVISIRRNADSWPHYSYQIVELQGNWVMDDGFLLENRVFQGKVGFELLMPFRLIDDHTLVLVNRGWLENTAVIDSLANSDTRGDFIKVQGQLYFPETGFTLGPALSSSQTWPARIQYIDLGAMSEVIDGELAPVVVVMTPAPDSGLTKIWAPYMVNATRHYGYAAQWWGLALVLIVFGFIWSRNSNN